MAFTHGSNSAFWCDNSAGTLTDLTAYTDQSDFAETVETAETTVFSNDYKTYLAGLIDSTMSVGGKWDPVVDAHMNALKGLAATTTVRYSPAGTGTGNPYYSVEAILTSYNVSGGVGDAVTWSAEFQCTGVITRTTH